MRHYYGENLKILREYIKGRYGRYGWGFTARVEDLNGRSNSFGMLPLGMKKATKNWNLNSEEDKDAGNLSDQTTPSGKPGQPSRQF